MLKLEENSPIFANILEKCEAMKRVKKKGAQAVVWGNGTKVLQQEKL